MIFKIITKYVEDFFIVSGLAIIVGTTFFISKTVGFYMLGAVFVVLGLFFAKNPPEGR